MSILEICGESSRQRRLNAFLDMRKSLPKISATGVLAKYGEQEDVGEEIEAKNEKTMMKRDVSDGHSD